MVRLNEKYYKWCLHFKRGGKDFVNLIYAAEHEVLDRQFKNVGNSLAWLGIKGGLCRKRAAIMIADRKMCVICSRSDGSYQNLLFQRIDW